MGKRARIPSLKAQKAQANSTRNMMQQKKKGIQTTNATRSGEMSSAKKLLKKIGNSSEQGGNQHRNARNWESKNTETVNPMPMGPMEEKGEEI